VKVEKKHDQHLKKEGDESKKDEHKEKEGHQKKEVVRYHDPIPFDKNLRRSVTQEDKPLEAGKQLKKKLSKREDKENIQMNDNKENKQMNKEKVNENKENRFIQINVKDMMKKTDI